MNTDSNRIRRIWLAVCEVMEIDPLTVNEMEVRVSASDGLLVVRLLIPSLPGAEPPSIPIDLR